MLSPEAKGERAREILESEVYQEAVQGAAQRIKDRWAGEPAPQAREALWHKLQAIEEVTRELAILRDRGIVERTNRERKESDRG